MPPIPPELAAVTLTRHPAPVADAMRALLAADSVHEQRDRVVECFRACVRVTAIVALAARLQGPAEPARDRELTALLAALSRRGLTDGQWVAVLRCAVAGLGARTDPVARELWPLLRGAGRRQFARALDELLQMRRKETVAHGPTGDNHQVRALLDRRMPALCTVLSSLTPLWTAIYVAVPLDPIRGQQRALALVGETPRQRRWQRVELGGGAPPYTPVLIGANARPLLRLEPWARVIPHPDGSVEALWCIEGNGAHVWLPSAEVRRLGGDNPFAVPAEVEVAEGAAPSAHRRRRNRWIAAGVLAMAAATIGALAMCGPTVEIRTVTIEAAAPAERAGAADLDLIAEARAALPRDPDRALAALAAIDPLGELASEARVLGFEARRRSAFEQLLPAHRARIAAIAIAPDQTAAVTGDDDGALRLWSPRDGTHRAIPGHAGAVLRLGFSPDGTWIASSGVDGTVRFWNLSRSEGYVMQGHEGWIEALAFSADGRWLASGSRDRTLRVWHLPESATSPRLERVLSGHRGAISAVAFSVDARLLVSAGTDATVRLWDRRSGRAQLLRGPRAPIIAAGFDPTGTVIAAARDGEVWSWDVTTWRGRLLGRHGAELSSMAIGDDGAIIVGGKDGRVRRWSDEHAVELGARASPVTALVPTAAGALAGHADGTIALYSIGPGRGDRLLVGHRGAVGALGITTDGILSGSDDGDLRVWRREAGDHDLRRGGAAIAGLAPTGAGTVVAGGADGVAEMQRENADPTSRADLPVTALAGAGELIVTGDAAGWLRATRGAGPLLEVQVPGAITWVGARADGSEVAALSADGELHRFGAGGERRESRCGPVEPAAAAGFGPGGALGVATWDGAISICDSRGRIVRSLEARGGVRDLAWSRDGAMLAAAGADGDVRIWRAGDTAPRLLRGHVDEITRVLFTTAGELVTSSRDGTVRLWDVSSGAVAILRGHARGVTALTLDGRAIVSGDSGGTVIFWRDLVPGAGPD